jgi:hypothetical protein
MLAGLPKRHRAIFHGLWPKICKADIVSVWECFVRFCQASTSLFAATAKVWQTTFLMLWSGAGIPTGKSTHCCRKNLLNILMLVIVNDV